jgi:LL-diaminopimelate aminotransferase
MPLRAKRLDLAPTYVFAELAKLKAEAEANGAKVIDLGVGDPDAPTPQGIRDALKVAVENPVTHHYDLTPRGWPRFLNAATDWYAREFGVKLDPKTEAVELIGSKEGLAHLIWAYVDPGDVVILPNPAYSVYRVNTLFAGGEPYEYALTPETNYHPDLSAIPSEIAKRAKLFFICYPNNPTGAVSSIEFFQDLVAFCREHDILIVSDMAYATVAYEGYKVPTVLQVEGAKDITIEFHSLSKMFQMTGWRLGFALGNSEVTNNLQRMKTNIDTKAFAAIAEAGVYALQSEDPRRVVAQYERRRNALCEGLRSIGWDVETPKASFYVWAKIPRRDMTSYEFAMELLRRSHVMVTPGDSYGSEGEGFVRFSLTLAGDQDGEMFREAVRRIAESGILAPAAV